jgi:hypothetical protein
VAALLVGLLGHLVIGELNPARWGGIPGSGVGMVVLGKGPLQEKKQAKINAGCDGLIGI